MHPADPVAGQRSGRAAAAAPRRSRAARAAAGLGSLLVLTALVAGLPAALYDLAGSPIPHRIMSLHQAAAMLARPDDGTLFLAAVRLASWIAWAAFAFAVLAETSARIRGLPAPRLVFADPVRGFAAALVGTAMMGLLPVLHPSPGRSPAVAVSAPAATAPPPAGHHMAGVARPASPRHRPGAWRDDTGRPKFPARARQYRVRPGDDLWDIAARFLGNGYRWRQIFALNRGKPQPGGQQLADPGFIEPGWTLRLPLHAAGSPAPARRHVPGRAAPPGRHPQAGCQPPHGRPRPAPAPSPDPSRRLPDQDHRHGGPAVRLPGGGLIPLTVAISVSAAAFLAGIQRRRRYQPGTAAPSGLRASAVLSQPVISRVRQAAREAAVPRPRRPPPPRRAPGGAGTLPPGAGPAPSMPGSAGLQTIAGHGAIPLGVRDGSEVKAGIGPAGGLGLEGPGARAAARAILIGLLSHAPPGPGTGPAIILPAQDAAALMPGWAREEQRPRLPGLDITPTMDAALDLAETLILNRARLAETGPVPEPAPVVLIGTPRPAAAGRLLGVAESGRHLGFTAIMLGAWPPGITCHVGADGTATCADPALDGIVAYRLSTAEADAIIAVLAQAAGCSAGQDDPAHGKHARPGPAEIARLPPRAPGEPGIAAHAPAADTGALAPPAPAGRRPVDHAPQPSGPQTGTLPVAPASDTGTGPAAGTRRIVHVEVLGPLKITTSSREIGGGLRKARELIAFLAVHPDGASADAISEALWPDAGAHHATSQRNLALRKARDMLRAATGMTAPMWILHASGRYRLDPTLISTDLGQFTAALDRARHAPAGQARLAAWQDAAGLYRGELAGGESYDWAEPYAETARRRALDAWTAIAGILQPSDPGQALAALEAALGHDPYNEFLYQKIMRLQAAAGDPEAVRRTLSLLEAKLADLGLTPGTQTRQIVASLLNAQHRRAPRVGSE